MKKICTFDFIKKPLRLPFKIFLGLVFVLSFLRCEEISGQVLSEGFESGLPTASSAGTYTLTSGSWVLSANVQRVSTPHSGSYACQFSASNAGTITSPTIVSGGVSTVTFWAAKSGGTENDRIITVEYQVNGGSWSTPTSVTPTMDNLTTAYTQYTATINSSGTNIKIRFTASNNSRAKYLDDIVVYAYGTIAGCTTATNGQYPTSTFTPTCTGSAETITALGYAGEYSVVNVTSGTQYTFTSSIASYFITIATDATTPVVLATGTGSVTYTATSTTAIRFYTHTNSSCGTASTNMTRSVTCNIPCTPPAAPTNLTITFVGPYNFSVSWNSSVGNYQYAWGATPSTIAGSTTYTAMNINSATPNTTYYFNIRSGTNDCHSDWVQIPVTTSSCDAQPVIGSGTNNATSGGTSIYAPVRGNSSTYTYSYTQQIYTATELTTSGLSNGSTINSVGFYWGGTGNLTNCNNWTVYIGHRATATFSNTSDWTAVGSLTQVFSGMVSLPASAGWMNISLTTSFTWNGTDNIVIAVDENSAGYGENPNWQYTDMGSSTHTVLSVGGTSDINPSSPGTGTRDYWRPNLKICVTNPVITSPPVCATNLSPANGASNVLSSTCSWDAVTGATAYDVYFGTAATPPLILDSWTYTSVMWMDLSPNTTYYWKIVPKNAGGNASSCTVYSFTTGNCVDNIVGDGTSTTGNAPINSGNNYNYSQMIYLANELSLTGCRQINSISFYWSGTGSLTNSTNWTVYLGNTSATSFGGSTSGYWINGLASYFTGTVSLPATAGWMTINLTTSFIWDGTSNIIVAIDENTSGSAGTSATWAYTATSNRTVLYYNGSTNIDPTTTITQNGSGYTYNRPNIKFNICAIPLDVPACTILSAPANGLTNVDYNTGTTLTWTTAVCAIGYKVYFGTDNIPTNIINGTSQTGTTYATGVLLPSTTYYWKIVAYNAVGDAVDCTIRSFTTAAAPDPCEDGVQITSTNSGNNDYYPINAFYGYGYTQQIYLASEIGTGASQISKIAFNVATSAAASIPVRIYMGHTSNTTLTTSTYIGTNNMTQVYNGNITFNATGWKVINLDLSFEYNGTDNIVVAVYSSYGGGGASSYPYFYYSITTGYNRTVYCYKDNSTLTLPTTTGTPTPSTGTIGGNTATANRPNIKFFACQTATNPPLCTTLSLPADGATNISTTPTLSWAAAAAATGYRLYYGTTLPLTTFVNVIGTSYTFPSSLALNTTYYWYVVPYNGVGLATGCENVRSFATVEHEPCEYTLYLLGEEPDSWTYYDAHVEIFINNISYGTLQMPNTASTYTTGWSSYAASYSILLNEGDILRIEYSNEDNYECGYIVFNAQGQEVTNTNNAPPASWAFANVFCNPEAPNAMSCYAAQPFCASEILTFPVAQFAYTVYPPAGLCYVQNYAGVEIPNTSLPNPNWYWIKIENSGTMTFAIESNDIDPDFAAWGPFSEVSCDASALICANRVGFGWNVGNETLTIANAQAGEYYMIMISNFYNQTGTVSMRQTSGTGSTDCSIVEPPVTSNSPVCIGGTIELTATTIIDGVTYTWTLPDGSTKTGTTLTIPNATSGDAGRYSLQLTASGGWHSTPVSIDIVVSLPPSFTLNFDGIACSSTSNIEVEVNNPFPISGNKFDIGLDGNETQNLQISPYNLGSLTAGTHTVSVKNSLGCIGKRRIRVIK